MELNELNVGGVLAMFKEAFEGIERHDYVALRAIADAFNIIGDDEFAAKLREMEPRSIKEEYWHQVESAAEDIVGKLLDEECRGRAWERIIERDIHDHQNTHEWVMNTDKAAEVLKYSKHPSAEIFNHGLDAAMHNDDFPFSVCAAGAFEMDLRDKVEEILRDKHNIDLFEATRGNIDDTDEGDDDEDDAEQNLEDVDVDDEDEHDDIEED